MDTRCQDFWRPNQAPFAMRAGGWDRLGIIGPGRCKLSEPRGNDSCPAIALIEQFASGKLAGEERQAIESHLADCPACRLQVDAHAENSDAIFGQIRAAQGNESPDANAATLDAGAGPHPNAATIRRLPEIEGYETVRELHRGGQGIVFQAIQKSTKRKVAIKVLLEGAYASSSARRRFEREIELVAQLKHPNIIEIFDSGETPNGHAYCVMDYIRGSRLDQFVRDKKLNLEDALILFQQVCDAVNYAHQKGVIHRDLKPSNILVDSDGTPKVLDFGLAKQTISQDESLVSITGQVVGTLPYMSPEQVRGNPDEIDTRTDVYSLGVILYEMLTGEYPYPVVGQMADVLKHIAETAPTPPSRSWKSASGITTRSDRRLKAGQCPIDDELQTIVLMALSKDRTRRYQTANELVNDVGHYLAGEPIEAKRDSAIYVLRKQLKRYQVPVVTACFFVALLIVFSIAMWIQSKNNRKLAKENETIALRERNAAQQAIDERDRALEAEARADRQSRRARQAQRLTTVHLIEALVHKKIDEKYPGKEPLQLRARRAIEDMYRELEVENQVAVWSWLSSHFEHDLAADLTIWPATRRILQTIRPRFQVGRELLRLGFSLRELDCEDAARPLLVEAESLLRECKDLADSNLTSKSPLKIEVTGALGECLLLLGRYDEAEPLLLEEYESTRQHALGTPHRLHASVSRLVRLYEAVGKEQDAARYRSVREEIEKEVPKEWEKFKTKLRESESGAVQDPP